jgi:hypothetical protein
MTTLLALIILWATPVNTTADAVARVEAALARKDAALVRLEKNINLLMETER